VATLERHAINVAFSLERLEILWEKKKGKKKVPQLGNFEKTKESARRAAGVPGASQLIFENLRRNRGMQPNTKNFLAVGELKLEASRDIGWRGQLWGGQKLQPSNEEKAKPLSKNERQSDN